MGDVCVCACCVIRTLIASLDPYITCRVYVPITIVTCCLKFKSLCTVYTYDGSEVHTYTPLE